MRGERCRRSLGQSLLGGPLHIPIQRVNPESAILEVKHSVLHGTQLSQSVLTLELLILLLFFLVIDSEQIRVEELSALVEVVSKHKFIEIHKRFFCPDLLYGLSAPSLNTKDGFDHVEESGFVPLLDRQDALN